MTERALGSRVTLRVDSARGFHDAIKALQRQMAEEYLAMGSPAGLGIIVTVMGDGQTVSGEVSDPALALIVQPC